MMGSQTTHLYFELAANVLESIQPIVLRDALKNLKGRCRILRFRVG